MTVVVTGAAGFLGWHLRCALRAAGVTDVRTVDRAQWSSPAELDAATRGATTVYHLAGANRAEPDELRDANSSLAATLTASLDRTVPTPPTVVFANSIQAGNGTPFGDGKSAASSHLADWGRSRGARIVDARLPNLFGEHGRPRYNSVVATFCDQLARGEEPTIHEDRELPLLHVQDAVDRLVSAADDGSTTDPRFDVEPTSVSAVLGTLREFSGRYATGDIPDVGDHFRLALFNTYRSFTFPHAFPILPVLHADDRGRLFEFARSGGQGQSFASTTAPGRVRGEHWHRRKVERFLVLAGTAEIRLRRLFDEEVVTFRVDGDTPAIVDMPTMWAHSLTNVGDGELVTLFWASPLLDPEDPDTFREPVDHHQVA
ncbi:UDP-2-acetamido-2,6-beta-L-arabino-hexul-4-ose reductase [Jatrophihabitans endophyticus]|uniref:UDP-2-acetamido-2,6-beta-L-arabino-hexul-4-ose reductase n=1 Tax=Jatrophihabitans endophyticus TaxID=1206085 RepID=A0A1M5INU7_9ACTN|nr:NAD-dependent epimerase/dehydratase family protein [Jatrophihabitans endophyticus]SHG29982.1 UDP-2-acetamido-2,6-beta-L-arabino-hexul-4-ose reductase [Jatrophihabitans endophyticus]